jgi:hypothetical protein
VVADPRDPDALARAMVEAAALDRRRVRRIAEERCSLERMVDAYEGVYDEVIGQALHPQVVA